MSIKKIVSTMLVITMFLVPSVPMWGDECCDCTSEQQAVASAQLVVQQAEVSAGNAAVNLDNAINAYKAGVAAAESAVVAVEDAERDLGIARAAATTTGITVVKMCIIPASSKCKAAIAAHLIASAALYSCSKKLSNAVTTANSLIKALDGLKAAVKSAEDAFVDALALLFAARDALKAAEAALTACVQGCEE